PDTRHYLFRDIYTHVSSVPLREEDHEDHEGHSDDENYEKPVNYEVNLGDTVRYREGYIRVKGINRNATVQNIQLNEQDIAIGMQLEVNHKGKIIETEPVYMLKDGSKFDFGRTLDEAGLKLRFANVFPERDKLELIVYQKPKAERNWVVMKAIEFPYINLFWSGTIIMVIGFILSIFRRNKELKRT